MFSWIIRSEATVAKVESKQVHINQIDSIIQQISHAYLNAFAEGEDIEVLRKQNPPTDAARKLAIFTTLWGKACNEEGGKWVSKGVKDFSSLKKLDQYFDRLLVDVVSESSIFDDGTLIFSLTKRKQEICKQIIQVVHLLARQKFCFQLMMDRNHDDMRTLDKVIVFLRNNYESYQKGSHKISSEEIKKVTSNLEQAISQTLTGLMSYGLVNKVLQNHLKKPELNLVLKKSILDQCERLADPAELNKLIAEIKRKREEGDDTTLRVLERKARAWSILIQDVLKKLLAILDKQLAEADAILKKLNDNQSAIEIFRVGLKSHEWVFNHNNLIADMSQAVYKKEALMTAYTEIQAISYDLSVASNSQSTKEKFTLGLVQKGWGAAASQLGELNKLADNLANYTKEYLQFAADIKKLELDIDQLKEASKKEAETIKDLRDKLQLSRQSINRAFDEANEVAQGLAILGREEQETVVKIIKRHWWKMLIAAILLPAMIVGLLFFAGMVLTPLILAVIIPATLLIGLAVGLLLGLVIDHFCFKPTPEMGVEAAEKAVAKTSLNTVVAEMRFEKGKSVEMQEMSDKVGKYKGKSVQPPVSDWSVFQKPDAGDIDDPEMAPSDHPTAAPKT